MKQRFGEGFGELSSLKGCAQIAVSSGVYIPKDKRGKGAGTASNQARLKIAKESGYDYILCTVRQDNPAQISILRKNDWSHLSSFLSSASDVMIEIWGKDINAAHKFNVGDKVKYVCNTSIALKRMSGKIGAVIAIGTRAFGDVPNMQVDFNSASYYGFYDARNLELVDNAVQNTP